MKNEGWPAAWLLIPTTLIGLVWLFWPVWPFESSDKITSYPVVCSGSYESGECIGDEAFLGLMHYRIDTLNNEVIEFDGMLRNRLEDCVIYDKENWKCQHPFGYAVIIEGGEQTSNRENFRFVSEWEYRWHQVKSFFGD